MGRLWRFVLVVAATAVVAACGEEQTLSVTGSVLIMEPAHFAESGSSCTGSGSFANVQEGAAVSYDGDAVGTLSAGTISPEGNCRFLFHVEVPDKDMPKRYRFAVAGMPPVDGLVNDRDPIYWQASDADGWTTIGWD